MNANWSAWSWFGLQVGCSIWMLAFGGGLLGHGQNVPAVICLVAFAFQLVVAMVLWRLQNMVTMEHARLVSFLAFSITTPAVWSCVTTLASDESLQSLHWSSNWQTGLFVFLVFPFLIGWSIWVRNAKENRFMHGPSQGTESVH